MDDYILFPSFFASFHPELILHDSYNNGNYHQIDMPQKFSVYDLNRILHNACYILSDHLLLISCYTFYQPPPSFVNLLLYLVHSI